MATGDISGRILIWHDFVNRVRPVKTVYHWHTLAVNSVCFSSEGLFILIFPFYYSIFNFCFPNHLGEYLYSGGLATWNVPQTVSASYGLFNKIHCQRSGQHLRRHFSF